MPELVANIIRKHIGINYRTVNDYIKYLTAQEIIIPTGHRNGLTGIEYYRVREFGRKPSLEEAVQRTRDRIQRYGGVQSELSYGIEKLCFLYETERHLFDLEYDQQMQSDIVAEIVSREQMDKIKQYLEQFTKRLEFAEQFKWKNKDKVKLVVKILSKALEEKVSSLPREESSQAQSSVSKEGVTE
jgi:hypothetical protein